jgi:hypothetical protein
MFIDYVALLLLNTAAAYFILAGYVYKGIDDPDQRKWALGFGIAGFISLLFGAVMCFTWPLPGPYNSAYGEMSVLLGTILRGGCGDSDRSRHHRHEADAGAGDVRHRVHPVRRGGHIRRSDTRILPREQGISARGGGGADRDRTALVGNRLP